MSYSPYRIHANHGTEFDSEIVRKMIFEIGAELTFSNVRDPSQNGLAEVTNKILINLARTLLQSANFKTSMWEYAVEYSVQVLNAITINTETGKSAFETFHKRSPYFREFYPFGTTCYFLDQAPGLKKFSPRGIEGRLVGLNNGVYGFHIWIPGTRKFVKTKHVTFSNKSVLDIALRAQPEKQQSAEQQDVFKQRPDVGEEEGRDSSETTARATAGLSADQQQLDRRQGSSQKNGQLSPETQPSTTSRQNDTGTTLPLESKQSSARLPTTLTRIPRLKTALGDK